MTQENVEMVRRGIEGVEAFWAMLDEHVVWDLRGGLPLPDIDPVYTGRDAVIEASRHYWGTWEDYRLDAEEIRDAGSSVFVAVRERMRARGAAFRLTAAGRRSGPSTEVGSSAGSCSRTGPRPSKPSDSRSR